jgi:hypothetical protein
MMEVCIAHPPTAWQLLLLNRTLHKLVVKHILNPLRTEFLQ